MVYNAGLYAKAIYAFIMAAATTLYMGLEDNGAGQDWQLTDREWVAIVIAGLTAVGVYLFPNTVKSTNVQTRP